MEDKWEKYRADKWEKYRAKPKEPMEPEEESFIKKLPRNALIGLANLGHRTLNSPHDLVASLENASEGFGTGMQSALPKELQKVAHPAFKLSEHIPTQEEHNYAELLGQKGEPTFGDTAIQKGIEYAPDLASIWGIYKDLPIALTRRGASKELRKAQELAKHRKIEALNISPSVIEDARQFLPNTNSYRTLLNEAALGNYNPIFALQSDLGKASRGFRKSPMFAERRHGKEAGKVRQELLNEFASELERVGSKDIAHLIREGQRKYRNYSRIRPYRNAALGLGATAIGAPYIKHLIKAIL